MQCAKYVWLALFRAKVPKDVRRLIMQHALRCAFDAESELLRNERVEQLWLVAPQYHQFRLPFIAELLTIVQEYDSAQGCADFACFLKYKLREPNNRWLWLYK